MIDNLRRAESKERNCITCQHCTPFENFSPDYKGTCRLQQGGPVKPTTICNQYVYEEKLDEEAKRILNKAW